MIRTTKSHEGSSILTIENEALNLALLEHIELLGHASKQKKKDKSSQKTKEKVVLTELSARITKSSFETGKDLLQVIENVLYRMCTIIKESSNQEKTLDNFIEIFSPDNRRKVFSVSRQAMKDNLPKDTKAGLDEKLQENYISSMNKLQTIHAKSREVILAIDITGEESTSKYINNQYGWVYKGQKNSCKRGFNHSSLYDCTNQMFISNRHQAVNNSNQDEGVFKDYLAQIQDACASVERTGTKVKYLDADRGYYQSILFAAAYLKLLTAKCSAPYDVKVIVPKVLTGGVEKTKIFFLEDPNSTKVSLDYITLSKYEHPDWIPLCEAAGIPKVKSNYQVPIAKVVVVDGYSNKNNRTLSKIKDEWQTIKNNLKSSQARLDNLNKSYVSLQKQKGVENPKPVIKLTGRMRIHKNQPDVYILYLKIYKTLKYIKRLKKDRKKILNSLTFFSISVTPEEVKNFNPKKYLKMVKIYRERWGIESGYKEDKAKFIRSCRSRKSTDRQWNLSLGMMLYNHWHVERMKLMLKEERKYRWNKVPWDSQQPFMRRKLERNYSGILGAESYLLRLFEEGIISRLEKVFR